MPTLIVSTDTAAANNATRALAIIGTWLAARGTHRRMLSATAPELRSSVLEAQEINGLSLIADPQGSFLRGVGGDPAL